MAKHRCYSEFRGGGTGALDAENGNNLTAGDHSIVRRADVTAEYIVKSSSASENFPFVITPDTNPGTLRHHLVTKTGLLNSYKESAGSYDEDFDGAFNNMTAVVGSSGTVDILASSGAPYEKYDFTSCPGVCCVQVAESGANKQVELRSTFTLADGDCATLAFSSPTICESTSSTSPGVAADEMPRVYFGLNDTSSYWGSGNGVYIEQHTETADTTKIFGLSMTSGSLSTIGNGFKMMHTHGTTMFFRVIRDSLTYHLWCSRDGYTWNYLGDHTVSSALGYVWVDVFQVASTQTTPHVITKLHWMRVGGGGVNPWPFL